MSDGMISSMQYIGLYLLYLELIFIACMLFVTPEDLDFDTTAASIPDEMLLQGWLPCILECVIYLL